MSTGGIAEFFTVMDSTNTEGDGLIAKHLNKFPNLVGKTGDTSIQRRVEDARKAGIHPLYALGANVYNEPPAKIGGKNKTNYGDAIRGAADTFYNSQLRKKQLASIDADITLKMARASEVSRRAQNMNSQQDGDIAQVSGLKLSKDKKDIQSAAAGLNAVTALGHKIKVGKQTPVQFYEEEYGQIAAELYGLMKYLNDRNYFNSRQLGVSLYNNYQKFLKQREERHVSKDLYYKYHNSMEVKRMMKNINKLRGK